MHELQNTKTLGAAAYEGVGDFFYKMIGEDKAKILKLKRKAYDFLVNEIGLAADRADEIIDIFMYAVSDKINLMCDSLPDASIEKTEKTSEENLQNLKHDVRSFTSMGHAGINTVEQLTDMTPDEMMKVRNLGKNSLNEVLAKLKELGLSPAPNDNLEDDDDGKDKCEKLRRIRKKIADANDIEYEPVECNHKGACLGTCPACDDEIKYIDQQLQKKKKQGKKINLSGIAADDIKKSSCTIDLVHSDT